MGATIPARIPPGSIDHVPFPTALTALSWGVFGFTRESSPEKKVFLFPSRVILRYVHRRGNRNASCSAGVAWSKSVAGARSSYVCSTSVAGAIGRSQLWQDQSPGKQPSSKKNCAMPPRSL
ncbi:hypothetical protein M9H77_00151 [Catharanthus roseus]|nr:hypothetical protein M9H77_00151 [Catharanthus roseus]